MATPTPPIDALLLTWANVDDSLKHSGILIGNGASRVIWDDFQYDSLYQQAQLLAGGASLTALDVALFTAYTTTNFEGVLQALATADRVTTALGKQDPLIIQRYDHIRQALVQAVHGKHIPHARMAGATLQLIAGELDNFEFVYSTNYDLLIYWSVMQVGAAGFKDFFWGPNSSFDLLDSASSGKHTRILYVHGGLHLYVDGSGDTCKFVANAAGGSILDQFSAGSAVPVFVSEGTSDDKLAAIYRSDYLSFAFTQLMAHTGPLVVLGQGLGDSDQHIVNAINRAGVKQLAIGIYPAAPQAIIDSKAHYIKCFPTATIAFFDMTTHPMGAPALKVAP